MYKSCFIAKQIEEEIYESIFCKYYGYIMYTGELLLANYSKREKVEKLIDNGWINYLDEKTNDNTIKKSKQIITLDQFKELIMDDGIECYIYGLNDRWQFLYKGRDSQYKTIISLCDLEEHINKKKRIEEELINKMIEDLKNGKE